ncbi:MAG TPA: glycosyltransferase [Phototrophicaceae bacterium]|nr:glycosyltransferase [Phototrophicaceae bacterium]
MTVLNEGASLCPLLDSLLAQTRFPDEVVIVDGGSSDNTLALLRSYENRLPLRTFVQPGCNISAGRNRAIKAARGEIIAVTDAGVILARDWLEQLTQPLIDNPVLEVVGGFFQADAHTIFEAALGATTLPLEGEIDADTFLPSSRSIAFRKVTYLKAGGYPEWLDYCEDLIFDLRLRALAAPFTFAPKAPVYFRPRTSMRAFFKQYYRYARGDGKADLWRKRHAVRYATYFVALPLILWLATRKSEWFWLLLLIGAFVYLRQPYRRLPSVLDEARRQARVRVTLTSNLYALALVPMLRVVGDVAKMIGYPVGWWWRIRNRPPDWRKI